MFILSTSKGMVLLLAYVDYLALFGDQKMVEEVKKRLSSIFDTTDLGRSDFSSV